MKWLLLFLFPMTVAAQAPDSLNTAAKCSYMLPQEREMLLEINRVRSNPRSYLPYIEPLLKDAEATLKAEGRGTPHYSLTYTTTFHDTGKETRVDTVWHFINEENVHALRTLVEDLKAMKPARILVPDHGVYLAGQAHRHDQDAHHWQLLHTGSDGSGPFDRIKKYSPKMNGGNENIAARYPEPGPRDIVLQLLIDAGIPGYGHRYNLLNPQWRFGACISGGLKEGMYQWIQEFAR